MSLGSFFHHLGSAIHSALVHIFGQSALDKVEADMKTIFRDDVRVIFMDAIVAAESLALGGADKRAVAFAQIVKDLATQGVDLSTHAINMGIELVVGLLRAKTPAAPAIPA